MNKVIVLSVGTILNILSIICKDLVKFLWTEGKTIHLQALGVKDGQQPAFSLTITRDLIS